MARIDIKVKNNNLSWSPELRPRVLTNITHSGFNWVNITGRNSDPLLNIDWLKIGPIDSAVSSENMTLADISDIPFAGLTNGSLQYRFNGQLFLEDFSDHFQDINEIILDGNNLFLLGNFSTNTEFKILRLENVNISPVGALSYDIADTFSTTNIKNVHDADYEDGFIYICNRSNAAADNDPIVFGKLNAYDFGDFSTFDTGLDLNLVEFLPATGISAPTNTQKLQALEGGSDTLIVYKGYVYACTGRFDFTDDLSIIRVPVNFDNPFCQVIVFETQPESPQAGTDVSTTMPFLIYKDQIIASFYGGFDLKLLVFDMQGQKIKEIDGETSQSTDFYAPHSFSVFNRKLLISSILYGGSNSYFFRVDLDTLEVEQHISHPIVDITDDSFVSRSGDWFFATEAGIIGNTDFRLYSLKYNDFSNLIDHGALQAGSFGLRPNHKLKLQIINANEVISGAFVKIKDYPGYDIQKLGGADRKTLQQGDIIYGIGQFFNGEFTISRVLQNSPSADSELEPIVRHIIS